MIRLKDVEMEYANGTRAIRGITLRPLRMESLCFWWGPPAPAKSTIIKLLTGEDGALQRAGS